jgi:hypothetical protein
MRLAGHVACLGRIVVYRVLVRRPEGKIPLVRPRHLWEDSIKVDVHGVGRGGMDWINLAQDRDIWQEHVIVAMNPRVPYNVENFMIS